VTRRFSGSLFWGLVFVVVGALVLAHNLGYAIPLWPGVIRYWPVILIVWGLFKLVDYFRMRSNSWNEPLFTGGDVAAVVFVILIGSLITLAANMIPNVGKLFNIGDIDIWDLTGNYYKYTEHQRRDASQGSFFEISNRNGDVNISPSDGDFFTLDVDKSVRAVDNAEAEKLSSQYGFSITNEGSKFQIRSNMDRRFKVTLTIHVPKQSSVSVENRSGKVTLKGLTGTQEIKNGFGDTEARDLTGGIQIHSNHGEVHLDNVGDAVIDNSFAPTVVSNARGSLKISGNNNSVDVLHVDKDLDVETRFQNVDVRDPKGAVSVKNRNGDVSITFSEPPSRDVNVSAEFGAVTLEVPANASFGADVITRLGEIHSDFSELQSSGVGPDHTSSGHVGTGGPSVRIETRNGEVRIRKRG